MFAKIALSLALIFGLHLFHHHCHKQAKACGGVQAVAVQSFAVAQPCYQQSFAVAAPVFVSPVYAQPVYAAPVAVQAQVFAAPARQRTVVRQRTVIRSGF